MKVMSLVTHWNTAKLGEELTWGGMRVKVIGVIKHRYLHGSADLMVTADVIPDQYKIMLESKDEATQQIASILLLKDSPYWVDIKDRINA